MVLYLTQRLVIHMSAQLIVSGAQNHDQEKDYNIRLQVNDIKA